MKDWLTGLKETMLSMGEEPIPKGYYSCEDAAKKWGVNPSAASKMLNRAAKKGLVDFVRLKRRTAHGMCRKPFYRPKKK